MKTFVRAIQFVRWMPGFNRDSGFLLNDVSSEAMTIDLSSLDKELSVYELETGSIEEIEKIAIKVYIDCLNSFHGGISLFVFTEEEIIKSGYCVVDASDNNIKTNPFHVKHYNITEINKARDVFLMANHIGNKLYKKRNADYNFTTIDIYNLLIKYIDIVKTYPVFSASRMNAMKKYFKPFKNDPNYQLLFKEKM